MNNFKTQFQTNEPSFYWPKLNTDKHGFIDWSWTAIQIMRFCNAFDDPFKGASTFFLGNHVRLMKTSVDDLKTIFHPYQSGIIYRKLSGSIWIATCKGGLKVDKVTGVEYNKLKLGKRFQTPFDVLEQAKTE